MGLTELRGPALADYGMEKRLVSGRNCGRFNTSQRQSGCGLSSIDGKLWRNDPMLRGPRTERDRDGEEQQAPATRAAIAPAIFQTKDNS